MALPATRHAAPEAFSLFSLSAPASTPSTGAPAANSLASATAAAADLLDGVLASAT